MLEETDDGHGEEATDVANAVYGRQPGRRALHAKGTLLKGTFTATPEAATLSRAAHMQGEPVPATIWVSNGGGIPTSRTMRRTCAGSR